MPVQPDDLTARARIREAALDLFSRDGVAATSMRSVAARAGVSPSLVVHHYGTKTRLREAVDDAVVTAFRKALRGVDSSGAPRDVAEQLETALSGLIGGDRALRDYLTRSLLEAGPAGDRLFGSLMDLLETGLAGLETRGYVRRGTDRTWRCYTAAFVILGPILLSRQIEARIGTDTFAPDIVRTRSACSMDILQHGLFSTPFHNH